MKTSFKKAVVDCVRGAGRILLRYFGHVTNPREKESQSSIVCDADLAAEKYILQKIGALFPDHNTISEESGRAWRGSEFTWVIDPLDGTSNFVAGLPWFGVMIAVLRGLSPVAAAMYLPTEDALYFAEAGQGARRNGRRVRVTSEKKLSNVLCAFGFDPTPDKHHRRNVERLFRVSAAVRNTRATNSLVDFCYAVDGRLGGCINLKAKIWDIAPMALILPEAGGKFTDLDGAPIVFQLDETASERNYTILGASTYLHPKLLAAATNDQ